MTEHQTHPRAWRMVGLRLHGRRPLAGLAHRAPLLRPPAAPRDGGRRAAATPSRAAEAAARLGWAETETDWRAGRRARRHRPRRHLHARRHPRRDRDRRARGRQARAVREAAGQHRRRGRGDGRGRRAGARRTAYAPWSASPTAGCRRSRWPASWSPRAGSARSATCARSTSRTGSPTRRPRCRGGWTRTKAGSGALGDIGAHIVDLTQFITGDRITEVTGRLETFVKERPLADRARRPVRRRRGRRARAGHRRRRRVVPRPVRRRRAGRLRGHPLRHRPQERDPDRDQRLARQPRLRLRGHERPGVLRRAPSDAETAGFRRILVTEPEHPYVAAWWPPGHGLGYEHGFTHQVVDLVHAIADGTDPTPSFADGLQVQRVLAAVETSSDTRTWQEIPA